MKKGIVLAVLIMMMFSACGTGAEKLPIDLSPGSAYTGAYERGDEQVYEDPTIRVERYRIPNENSDFDCTVYYAIVSIADASQLRTYPANGKDFCTTTRTPGVKLAKRMRAVLAINGDYPATFSGNTANTYVLRQGKVYRDTVEPGLDMLLIDEDGDFHVLTRDVDLAAAEKTQIDGKRVINAFQFGPALVIDGKPVDDESILDKYHSPTFAHPESKEQRMVIAQIDTLKYMVLCVAHYGASLTYMRDIAMALAPCRTVYVLDGGESAQMVFLGTLCNNTDGNKVSRDLADIIYFASAN